MMEADKKRGSIIILVLCGVLGLALMIGGSVGGIFATKTDNGETELASAAKTPEEYASEVEAKIVRLCSEIKGVSRVSAVVTLKGGFRTVYAVNSQSGSSGYRNELVLTGSGSSERAVAVCYENPEISGVGIVCRGGSRSEVRLALTELVSSAFGVSANKISVAEAE